MSPGIWSAWSDRAPRIHPPDVPQDTDDLLAELGLDAPPTGPVRTGPRAEGANMDKYQIGECAFVPDQETVIRVADVDGSKVYAEFTSGEKRWINASDLRKIA